MKTAQQEICGLRPVFVRSRYNYDTNKASKASGLKCTDESKAVQSQKIEADINEIVRRFGITGRMPENPRMPQYGDFTGIQDYQSCLNALHQADADFMSLPAHIRNRFENDPQQLLEFVSDRKNLDEAIKLGLVASKPENEPTAKGGVPPTGAEGKTGMAKQDKTGE